MVRLIDPIGVQRADPDKNYVIVCRKEFNADGKTLIERMSNFIIEEITDFQRILRWCQEMLGARGISDRNIFGTEKKKVHRLNYRIGGRSPSNPSNIGCFEIGFSIHRAPARQIESEAGVEGRL